MKQPLLFILALALMVSCRKKDDPLPSGGGGTGSMRVRIEHKVKNDPLVLQTGVYQNAHGDSYSVTSCKYFLSNFKVRKKGGAVVSIPESYFLVDQGNSSSLNILLPSLDLSEYDQLSFLIGVDSLRNVSGAQTGALDPSGAAQGMFWDWNTGYIMARLEGSSPQIPTGSGQFAFHMGGFKGLHSVLRTVTLNLSTAANVQQHRVPEVHLTADINSWFQGRATIDLSQTYFIMSPGQDAARMADNYSVMFAVDHVEN